MGFIIMYNYAAVTDITVWVSLYHFTSFGLKITHWYRLDTATCEAFGMLS